MRSDGEPHVWGTILSTGHRWSKCHELTESEAVISQMPSANLVLGMEVNPTSCLIESLTVGTSTCLKLSSE